MDASKISTRQLIYETLKLFGPVMVLALVISSVFYISYPRSSEDLYKFKEREIISLQKKSLGSDMNAVITDLKFFASNLKVRHLLEKDGRALAVKATVGRGFLQFSKAKSLYDQIRILDETGQEVVRINYASGQPYIVKDHDLQNKRGRYYFDDAFALDLGDIFISPLDLNVERGSVERPLKPMLRIGTPLSGLKGEKKGLLLLNYFGKILIERYRDIGLSSAGHSFLLNSDSYYLHSDVPDQSWGFMFEDKKMVRMEIESPDAWRAIRGAESGQFVTAEGLYTFDTFSPHSQVNLLWNDQNEKRLDVESNGQWKLVTLVPANQYYSEQRNVRLYIVAFLILTAIVAWLGAWRLAFSRMKERSANQERQEALEELKEAYHQLKLSQSKLLQSEKMASIGQLAAGVAHEINNPIGFVTGNLRTLDKYSKRIQELLKRQDEIFSRYPDMEEQAELSQLKKKLKLDFMLEDTEELIEESLDGTMRVQTIVQNLKTFSRVDQHDVQSVDLNECIDATLNIIWNDIKYIARVEKDYAELPLVICYPQQLSQVLMNLLINASHAIEDEGLVRVKTWHDDRFVYCSISDNGCGIPEDNLKKIFEPFFTTKEVGKGTGLGLSMVYDIVKEHRGDIRVDSEVGKGTSFTLCLPINNDAL